MKRRITLKYSEPQQVGNQSFRLVHVGQCSQGDGPTVPTCEIEIEEISAAPPADPEAR